MILLRHGQSEFNLAFTLTRRDPGIVDARLTPLGRERLAEGIALWATANRRTEIVLGHESASRLRMLADQVSSEAFLEAYKVGRAMGGGAGGT